MKEPEIEVLIEDVDHQGRGVCRIQGKACFVPGALRGETVRIRRLKRLRRYDEAELVEIKNASPDRIEPHCAHFGRCGGCNWQHVTPHFQLEHKLQALKRELKIAAMPATWLEPIVGDAWHYRRKARLGVKQLPKSGRAIIGFRERNSAHLANVRFCPVLAEPLASLVDPLGEMIGRLSIAASVPQLEVAVSEGRCVLVMRVLMPPTPDDRAIIDAFAQAHGVEFALQPKGVDSVETLSGGPLTPLRYSLSSFSMSFDFTPMDFVQVNAKVNEQLVTKAIDYLDLREGHRVLDLFCGLGNFTLPIATRGVSVLGVDGDQTLIERARAHARRLAIDHAQFECANLFEVTGREPWLLRSYDRVLLDPPRAGAKELMPWLVKARPQRVVMVSCHPGTLARDIKTLVEGGYHFQSAGILDMFTHTAHIESIAILDWRGV
jgi:23S rRNA (uracil1939-C5)-methyltransferase